MSKFRKSIFTLAMAFVFCVNIAGSGTIVFAKEISSSQESDLYDAGYEISDAMRLILEEYVGEEITVDQLYNAAMHGMMDALDDYSVYFSEEELNQFLDYFISESYGIGIATQYYPDGNIYISRVYAGSPADKAGIKKR